MSIKLASLLLLLSALVASGYKGVRFAADYFQKQSAVEQICRANESRLQVGSTREVADIAHAALLAAGYKSAEIELVSNGTNYVKPNINKNAAHVYDCVPNGIQNVRLSVYFPRETLLSVDVIIVFCFSILFLWLFKIALVVFVRGLQSEFSNELNKILSQALGLETASLEKTPFWMNWLRDLNPSSLREFKNRLSSLENKIERQAKDIQNQAAEKAVKESELVQARKFKDLVHQIRHDLRQTLGVVRASLETIPAITPGREVLKGSVSSLESMIEDLRERELKTGQNTDTQDDLIEVIVAEVANEQKIQLLHENISLEFRMNQNYLHFTKAPREELKRVITNLVVNATEAIADSGKINIIIDEIENNFVSIKIIDTGMGFSDLALKNLFKKGFSTKADGSGRGLSFAQQKIRSWNGRLLVESVPGKTQIEIILPSVGTELWASPTVLSFYSDIVIVDDYPINLVSQLANNTRLTHYKTLSSFELDYKQGRISSETLIIFDLHLEEGRKALSALDWLTPNQDYVFMTSDYLNPELIQAANKYKFLTIPKELMGFGQKDFEKISVQNLTVEVF